jgi:hypothetical protein
MFLMTSLLNFWVGWFAILVGLLTGATIGMFFHKQEWLGGYGASRRRMLRLVHISMVGTGLLNLAFAFSVDFLQLGHCPQIASILFVAGALTMPTVCALSAWRISLRHLFFVPVLSLTAAAADLIIEGFVL